MEPPFASTINRFAGAHAIPADPREVTAARRAGEASLREFPYYLERYGERGRLFAGSDGAWLVTVCGMEPEVALQEVLWLGRVLCSRGMPRWLLERHLEVLHAELARSLSGQADRYALLPRAAARLATLRRRWIPDAEAAALERAFVERADPASAKRLPEMPRILAAAAADEAAGIQRAVSSVQSWASDPARFSEAWISAVEETVAAARCLCARRAAVR